MCSQPTLSVRDTKEAWPNVAVFSSFVGLIRSMISEP
jgi:hypothetical protein